MSRPFLQLDSSGILLFDGLAAVCWQVDMNSSVDTPPRVKNITPGVLYTFIFRQNDTGNHRFAWPAACENAAPISGRPDSYTVQNFIGSHDGKLISNIPATYY